MQPKAKQREGRVSVPLDFDEAIRRALQVKPPPEGWRAYEDNLKKKKKKVSRGRSRDP
jgi:hypothetical protein